MKKIIGILLIIGAIGLGYQGVQTVDGSGGSVEVVGIEIGAEDTGQKNKGYMYIELAVVLLIGGVTLVSKK